jgi:hypothetical protein
MADTILSKTKIPIRLPDERWNHIVEKHRELAFFQAAIFATISNPDRIVSGLAASKLQFGNVLSLNYQKPSIAIDSEMTDDDVIVRYAGDEIIGMTVLHASHAR